MLEDAVTFAIGGRSYSLLFTARARMIFEGLAGYPLVRLRALTQDGTEAYSDRETAFLLVAGLEGHRRRAVAETRDQRALRALGSEWTEDRVVDEIFEQLSSEQIGIVRTACIEAVTRAFARLAPAEDAQAAPAAGGSAEGKAPTES